ncbi:MATE family efflux transporter [Streptomyces humi]|uniref:MATE family efflux transporter n=1 Tax=Streptomyces humi TaxID=1428620 RepID=UPI0006288A29|nr:MATE family efflux transporter [Streptomyces humi]
MKHTELTVRNYTGFATTIFLTGLVSVGFGAVDILLISPKGLDQVAAVGLGDVINAGLTALLAIGVVDTFSSRLAIAEGRGDLARRLPVLASALLVLLLVAQASAVLLSSAVQPGLRLAGQDPRLAGLAADFVIVRGCSLGFTILYAALNEALKICGLKNRSLLLLVVGLATNAALDWAFLYTPLSGRFASPVVAVAAATTGSQLLIACFALRFFLRRMRARGERFTRPERASVVAETRSMARNAPGVGARHFNDYAGTITVTLLLGTLGVQVLAAVTVATKIWSLFCRIPQACVSGTFVYYGYRLGQDESDLPTAARTLPATTRSSPATARSLPATARTLLRYAAVPTAAGAVTVALAAPWLVRLFAGAGQDERLTRSLLFAFLLTVPAYLLENHFGEILSVHQRGALLATASAVTTYALAVPLAAVGVFVLHSPFLVTASGVLPSAVLATAFHRSLRKDHWTRSEVGRDTGVGVPA